MNNHNIILEKIGNIKIKDNITIEYIYTHNKKFKEYLDTFNSIYMQILKEQDIAKIAYYFNVFNIEFGVNYKNKIAPCLPLKNEEQSGIVISAIISVVKQDIKYLIEQQLKNKCIQYEKKSTDVLPFFYH